MARRWLAGLVDHEVPGACAVQRRAAAPLGADAVLKAWARDLSSAVGPVVCVAELGLCAPIAAPEPFRLRHDLARAAPGHRMVLAAKIIAGDLVRHTNVLRLALIIGGCRADCEAAVDAMH